MSTWKSPGDPTKVLISSMRSRKKELSFEECLEKDMTKTQKEVFLIVDEFWRQRGYAPSVREIMGIRKKKSLGSTNEIVDRLIRLGVLKKVRGMDRSVRPVYINFRNLE